MNYLAQVINSTLREITPILLVSLCAGVCSKVQVFNIALEGTLLMSAFFAFLTHYFLRNIFLSVAVAMVVAMGMTFIMSFFIVKLKGQPMIVGMALNTFARGFTTFLLSVVFKTKGAVNPSDLKGLTKLDLPGIRRIPFVSTMFSSLTVIDYLAFVLAVVMFIIMYRTVIGFRLRALGINQSAASSLGINVPNDARGALQDTHWSGGLIGYFPTYAYGSAIGAQLKATMVREGMDFDGVCASGDLTPIHAWLRDRIWRFGRSRDTSELILDACGEPFSPAYFTDYLTEKFSALYGL